MNETAGEPLQLAVDHHSSFVYTEAAGGTVMLLRVKPRQDAGQTLMSYSLDLEPLAAPVALEDAFGNTCHLFNIHREHDRMDVRSSSRVETVPAPDLPERLEKGGWERLRELAAMAPNWDFLAPTGLTRPGAELEAFLRTEGIEPGDDPLVALRGLAGAIYERMEYVPGSTDVHTTIDQVIEARRGVCQDYAHLMLAIARSWGVPSRYVSGYMLVQRSRHEQSAENASHAWAEFLLPEIGWLGIDPTNDSLADHRHVRIAIGRDYNDAAPTRGTVFGGGEDQLEVSVSVRPADVKAPPEQPRRAVSNLRNVAPTRDMRGKGSGQQQQQQQ